MPRGDKTGPNGQGAMTGRKMGLCTGNSNAGYFNATENYGLGRQNRGFGNRRGRGFGFSRGFAENTNPSNQSDSENQQLRNEISKLQSRLNDLEKKS